MRQPKNWRRSIGQLLIATFFCLSSPPAWSASGSAVFSAPDAPLADDNIMVLLAQHTNREQEKALFLHYVHATTINDIHFDKDDISIFVLSPQPGLREQTINKLAFLALSHPEIIEIMRDHLWQHNAADRKLKPATKPNPGTGPNDPNYFAQWEFGNMMWTQAYNNYAGQMTNAPTVVVLGNDCVPSGTELGPNITKYNAFMTPVQQFPVNPKNADSEGCADSSIPGALTNNNQYIAGAACFQSALPCQIILMKCADSSGSTNSAVINAIAFIVNNKASINGGHGVPCDLSYNSDHMWSSKTYQRLGQELLNANDLLVIAAGDTAGKLVSGLSTGNVAVVQATNYDNDFFLTKIQNDSMAAPGLNIPIINLQGVAGDNFSGSSAACPLWGASVALLIAFNQNLSAAQANQILVNTGTSSSSPWFYAIPNINAAINAALTQTPPTGSMPPTIPK